ncbi:MAG: hypothetical protein ABIH23_14930 [bacterium]
MKDCLLSSRIPLFFGSVLLVALLATNPVLGQEPVYKIDFDSSNDTLLSSTVDSPPAVLNAADGPFTVTVVLTGATQLMGVNCDLVFDNTHLQVVNIQETAGDVNFDGRANVFDIREVGERLNATEGSALYEAYFDRANGQTDGVIDMNDVNAVSAFFAKPGIFWTVNTDNATVRESTEIFEDPSVSNENGLIDDIVCMLLPRDHPPAPGFGFNGDARIAEITFQPVNGFAGMTTLSFSETWAVDENTHVDEGTGQIVDDLYPQSESVEITVQ